MEVTTPEPSDEELRKLLKPSCSFDEVKGAILSSFAKKDVIVLKELDSYDDQNFLIEVSGTTKYLVKVHNGVESKDFVNAYEESGNSYEGCSSVIHLQCAMMQHLSERGIKTSNPQTSNTGMPLAIHELPVVSKDHSPCNLVVKMMTWVPGRTMSSLPALPVECIVDAGRYLGKIRKCLDEMDYMSKHSIAAKRFHVWDGKNTMEVRNFTNAIEDTKRRAMVESILDTFSSQIIDLGIHFSKGLLQGDFNDANILVNENFQVDGVIDFGDSTESWKILDLSVAMAYAMVGSYGKRNRSIAAALAMLRGYIETYGSLEEVELNFLHLLICCRLSCSVTLGAYSHQQNPTNQYLLLHAQPAWEVLELIWGHDEAYRLKMTATLEELFRNVCNEKEKNIGYSYEFPDPNIPDLLRNLRRTVFQADDDNNK